MLNKVKRKSPFIQIRSKMEWVLSWVMSHTTTKCHGNQFRSFCLILLTNRCEVKLTFSHTLTSSGTKLYMTQVIALSLAVKQ